MTEIKNLGKSQVEITGELSADVWETYRKESVKELVKNADVPGFRKGHVPENILVQNIGEMKLLEEMARRAIAKAYPDVLKEHKIDALGYPAITITKIAKGEALGFKITTAVMPEVNLPDYKSIAKEEMEKETKVEVTDKELEEVIANILKQHDINKDSDPRESASSLHKSLQSTPSELTDEFVKKLGDFKDVADFKIKVRENMKHEKEMKERQRKRAVVMENIIKKVGISLPDIVIDGELSRMEAQFEGDISRMGLKFEEYLKHIKKTREDLRKEWRTDAEKRALSQVLLAKIAKKENVTPDKERLEKEIQQILSQHKDAKEEHVKSHVTQILTNEAVFERLESLSTPT